MYHGDCEPGRTSLGNVVVALDWSPNTNHTGFYVAKAKGYYTRAGLKVRLLGANEKEYEGSYTAGAGDAFPTPCAKLAAGRATFAMNSPEGAVGWSCPPFSPDRPQLRVVAAVLQEQSSALVTLKRSGLDRPAALDGKKYASYGARFEGRIVRKMVEHDGGRGEFVEETPPMLGIFGALLNGEYDATWVFTGWEGVEAELKGVELNAFKMQVRAHRARAPRTPSPPDRARLRLRPRARARDAFWMRVWCDARARCAARCRLQDFGVPYGYAPCLLAHPTTLEREPALVRDFLAATAAGFQWAAANPDEAAELLVRGARAENGFEIDPALAAASQKVLSPQYLTPSGVWGAMDPKRWEDYVAWLAAEGLLTTFRQSRAPEPGVSVSLDELRAGHAGEPLDPSSLPQVYTNAFLPDDGGFAPSSGACDVCDAGVLADACVVM